MMRLAREMPAAWAAKQRKGFMTGHSILYLGRGEFAAEYLSELETLPFCALLTRSHSLKIPVDAPSVIDLVLLEAGPSIAQSGFTIAELIGSFDKHPVVALTTRERRGQISTISESVCGPTDGSARRSATPGGAPTSFRRLSGPKKVPVRTNGRGSSIVAMIRA